MSREPRHMATLTKGPSLITCSGATPVWCTSRWSMLRNKRMMHFGPWEEDSSLSHRVSSQSVSLQRACAHAEAATVVGSFQSFFPTILVAPTRLLSSPHHLLAGGGGWGGVGWGGMLRFGSRSVLYVLSCLFFFVCFFSWVSYCINLTCKTPVFEWCYINQVDYYTSTHLFPR